MLPSQFVLIAYDAANVLDKRMACRAEHIALIDKLRAEGKALMGAALTNDMGQMIGSIITLDMTEAELDNYLKIEPYVVNGVWDKIEIKTCKGGPSFVKA